MTAFRSSDKRTGNDGRPTPPNGTNGTNKAVSNKAKTKLTAHHIARPLVVAKCPTTLAGDAAEGCKNQKARALEGFRNFGTVTSACRAAGIGRRTWYNWLECDPEFAPRLAEMKEDAADELEAAAYERALASSDRLLIFLLKANRPWMYRENAMVTMVSPIVKEHVRETVKIIRQMLPKEQSEAVLARLNVVWQ